MVPNGPWKTLVTHGVPAFPGPAPSRVSLVMMVAVRVAAAVVAASVPLTQKGRAMLAAIEGMIAELRQIGVPVSLAERIDAVHSLRHLPVGDRATVKAALRAVLVKTHDHELAQSFADRIIAMKDGKVV